MIKTMKIGPSIMKTNVKRLKIGALKAWKLYLWIKCYEKNLWKCHNKSEKSENHKNGIWELFEQ